MKNFYCIIDKEVKDYPKRCELLEEACKKRSINFVKVSSDTYSFVGEKVEKGSLIYRATPGDGSRALEKHLLNDSTISFYPNLKYGIFDRSNQSYIFNEKANLPIIKTVTDITNREKLMDYVEYLDGFPVVVKIIGGSHGVGVVRVDSKESLLSLADFLNSEKTEAILRKYIDHKKQGRLIVLGNEVIASHINYSSKDFRTNVGSNLQRKREAFVFPENIQDIAVKVVDSMGYEFGGVDILFDEKTNEPYIAEVNFPFYFPMTQKLTGIDIAGKMIDYLLEKSKKEA